MKQLLLFGESPEPEESLEVRVRNLTVVDVGLDLLNPRSPDNHFKKNKNGLKYVGLCPFHKERTPPFNLRIKPNYFICYGCGMSGGPYGLALRILSQEPSNFTRDSYLHFYLPSSFISPQDYLMHKLDINIVRNDKIAQLYKIIREVYPEAAAEDEEQLPRPLFDWLVQSNLLFT